MTDAQKQFIELDKKKVEYKEFVEQYTQAINDLIEEMGIGGHFQDVDGTVYQTANCDGKFVYFDKHEIKRDSRLSFTKW